LSSRAKGKCQQERSITVNKGMVERELILLREKETCKGQREVTRKKKTHILKATRRDGISDATEGMKKITARVTNLRKQDQRSNKQKRVVGRIKGGFLTKQEQI